VHRKVSCIVVVIIVVAVVIGECNTAVAALFSPHKTDDPDDASTSSDDINQPDDALKLPGRVL
jgi:hypothetical protein